MKCITLQILGSAAELRVTVPVAHAAEAHALFDEFCAAAAYDPESAGPALPFIAFAQFLEYIYPRHTPLAAALLSEFQTQFLCDCDIHVAVSEFQLDITQTQAVLRAYYSVWDLLQHEVPAKPSALFANPEGRLLAIFGGQGGMDDYINETRFVYTTYLPLVVDYVASMAEFLKREASAPRFRHLYSQGFDIIKWITDPSSVPDHEYMTSVPVSIPAVGLTQLMHIVVSYKTLGVSPGEFAGYFKAAAGHSQGITIATALSMAKDEQSFYEVSKKALGILMVTGTFPQLDYPRVLQPMDPNAADDLQSQAVSPMVAVIKLTRPQLERAIAKYNQGRESDADKVYLSLSNCVRMHVVSGAVESLEPFVKLLVAEFDHAGIDQTRVPFSQRKPGVVIKYLSINGPYHCKLLEHAAESAYRYTEERGWIMSSADMQLPVRAGDDGHDIRSEKNVVAYLMKSSCILPVNWIQATDLPDVTHIVDFGPGGFNGFGALTFRNHEGQGVPVICVGAYNTHRSPLGTKTDLYKTDLRQVKSAPNWRKEFAPRLVRTLCDGQIHIDTRMSRLLGKPPVMVAGMTPSTVSELFVSAVMRAGYHIELSGGGHFSEPMLRDKVGEILKLVDNGHSITINSIYVNPFLWNIQYPAMQSMRREGVPLDGLCIGAGVPSFEVANEIIHTLRAVGFRHIGLKPSSIATIRLVIKIAQANPDFPVMLQWTGGRGGGHHSFEDFHQPILETYGAIRAQKNIVLVAGSGFGGVDDTLPYLTGEWSKRFECAPMPFDGVLLGSRVMAAKEGQASDSVKEAIVAAPGITDAEWEQTYKGPAGGVVTVLSEMGEPIHKIATRGVLFWKEMDDTIFSQPRDKRLPLLLAKKDYIIDRLNKDFQKPWFGKKADGRAVDLDEMTYAEVANRLLEVLYVKHQSRWIDVTMRNLTGDYLRQLEQRFISSTGPSYLQSFNQLNNEPYTAVKSFLDMYPESYQQLLSTEDVQSFINLCMRPGQKPVPFIPIMDKDFHIWLKKDSLWQAEDIDAVADQDVGRVCILQGPVAVRYSTKANEPVKDILDNIYHGQIASLLDTYYGGDESRVPDVAYLGSSSAALSAPVHVQCAETESQRTFVLSRNEAELPDKESWIATLAGTELNWLHALLTTQVIAQHRMYANNSVRRVLRPHIGQMVNITLCNRTPQKIVIINSSGEVAMDMYIDSEDIIHFNMYTKPRNTVCTLEFIFRYVPSTPFAPIHEIMVGRNQRIKRFYAELWFENSSDGIQCIGVSDPEAEFVTEDADISGDDVLDFCYTIGNVSRHYVDPLQAQRQVPLDYAIRVFWPTLSKCLMAQTSDGDLLNLVHLSNGFRMLSSDNGLMPGQAVSSDAKIIEVMDTASGRRVLVRGFIKHKSVPVVEVTTSFLFRSCLPDYASNFRNVDEQVMSLRLASRNEVALLNSKEWFVPVSSKEDMICPGSVLEFRLQSQYRFKSAKVFASICTFGAVYVQTSSSPEPIHVGDVDYEAGESYGNPVIAFLERFGSPADEIRRLESEISLVPASKAHLAIVTAPADNQQYADVSTDHNPIHTSSHFADYAGLPGTITHGMWTSAAARRCVEIFAARGCPERVRAYEVQFTDMVLPGDQLETKLYHVGMKGGRMLVRVETVNQNGTTVLTATAEIEQPPTVIAFPGQGAHEPGMGMELYARSEHAREIWDSANQFMRTTYGIPLIDIVRNNPKSYTVHFVGERGMRVRENYRDMVYEYGSHDGAGSLSRPLFPEITESTDSFTFSSPNGLLYATQFTQPAMLLCEIAEFAHLMAKSVVPKHPAFAGHSLGEYAGLTAIANIMTPESAADLGFCRGLTMQQSVRRDSSGRSIYAMMAVSPTRIGKWFSAENLESVVNAVQLYGQYDGLLEIVNYNVRNEQYVVSGELILLEALNQMLEAIVRLKHLPGSLEELTKASVQSALQIRERDGYIAPRRTSATIPIGGIDVPFHSSILGAGVQSFRKVLQTKISPSSVSLDRLRGHYIPNLTARPFDVTKEYMENVYALTNSPFILELVKNYSPPKMQTDPGLEQHMAYTLLIEILAYQFSSPVRWIETQDVLLTEIEVGRFVEVGPGSVLSNMLKRSLSNLPPSARVDSDAVKARTNIMCVSSEMAKILYQEHPVADSAPAIAEAAAAPTKSSATETPAIAQPAAADIPPTVTTGGGGGAAAEEVSDVPVQPLETIRALIAYKLKCSLSAIPADRPIKDFVGGKSTVQNEIIGDLQKEFKDDFPEKPEEIPLSELAQSLSPIADSLGKHSSTLVARMISSKMPGGYGRAAISKHLSAAFGLGPMRQCGLFLVGLTLEPAARLDSESSAKAWLASVAQEYATHANIAYKVAAGNGGGQGSGSGAVAVINSAEFEASQLAQKQMVTQQLHVLARYLGINIDAALNGNAGTENQDSTEAEGWLVEHGEFYADNFKPKFSALMARHFDSSWNWARQDLIEIYYRLVQGKVTRIDLSMASDCLQLVNRLTPSIMDDLRYIVSHSGQNLSHGYRLANKCGRNLLERCNEGASGSPVYQFTAKLLAPCLQMDHAGGVVYKEIERSGEKSIMDYVMSVTDSDASLAAAVLKNSHAALDRILERLELSDMFAPTKQNQSTLAARLPPMVHLRSKAQTPTVWSFDPSLSETYTSVLKDICENGLTFANKKALVTGCGRGSIGIEVLKGLLEGGASVVVTTSNYSHKTMRYFQDIYQSHGSRGSQLVVVPFNQSSRQDIESLLDYVFGDASKGKCLGWDLDYVLPFAAIPEMGCEITDLGSQSELAHRAMLTNVLRLLGEIRKHKSQLGHDMHPTLAVLPLSPNHGAFGGDGLYGESKIGLETLFSRWHSESWSSFVTLSGAVIGWTRGTGLMNANNVIAECVERFGARTFSSEEMAFNILGLMHPRMYALAALSPVWADMAGNFQYYPSLTASTATLRRALRDVDTIQKAVAADSSLDYIAMAGSESERVYGLHLAQKRANHRFAFPDVKSYEQLEHLRYMQDMVDLDKVVVVTGYGEVGLFGNAELRWEMEAFGEFSLEGCIELAWIMGLIRHFNGKLKSTGKIYTGWVDAKSEEPVRDMDVKSKYEKHILEHTGIRLIEPELLDGYDPRKKGIMCEVQLEHDMEPFEATAEEASQFQLRNGDKCSAWASEDGSWSVKLLKGATIMVPKALRFDRLVAAQLPAGWSAERYGIPKDIADQVDPVTCYAVVATVEALVRSGITDPYEIYQYVHVSEIGSSSGTALGGLKSMKHVFADRLCDKDQQPDVYQETFVTTPPAWINMLLLSASGPIKTTIGACASSVASIDVAIDTILSGKARIMVAGGMDGFCEESSYEFAQMNATSNSNEEFARGRTPAEMSRPCTTTRSGFMEGEGAGIAIVMSASTALQMGAPIHGILAMTGTATDKEGRSVPAPGQGVLTSARETINTVPSPLLDMKYRRRQLKRRQSMINEWRRQELDHMRQETSELRKSPAGLPCDERTFISERTEFIDHEAMRQLRESTDLWGNFFWRQDPRIAPLRGSLAVWGLTIDDIGVASFHGTSTKANDKNESEIINCQLKHLGRTRGNPVLAVCQKWLTGHPKGAAAAWMLNGAMQILRSGIVPGNRNADNIAAELEKFDYIVYPSRSIKTDGVKAVLLKSFGFGQVGGEILVIHPDYLLAALSRSQLDSYTAKVKRREQKAYRHWHNTLAGSCTFVQVKNEPPYSEEQEQRVYLDPLARTRFDKSTGKYTF